MNSNQILVADEIADGEVRALGRSRTPRPVREQQMISVASVLFGEHGYHSVSMDQIAEAVGISKPMVYAYFESKEGLCIACLRRAGADAINAIGKTYQPSNTPEQALWSGFLAFFSFVRSEPQSWRLIRRQENCEVEIFQRMVAEIISDLLAVVQELVRIASRETEVDPFAEEASRIALSHALFGAASSIADRWLEDGFPGEPEDSATALMNFFWVGIGSMTEGESWSSAKQSPITES